ncbi:formate dehydrogenase subunit delta [Actinoplanes solisilvae]|uniref:formate dehydrogenase subunit delta n=1 Tax=Actinoplanes solisilvae TaxID=2486853 RepID=UPI000FDC7476|nr:formate dehydrogenase subunit delta [Actinoplanes solisilvae]
MSPQIRMINDIAVQFQHQAPDAAAAAIAEHIRAFWDPRMRAELMRRVDSEPEMLDPIALAAARLLTTG